MSYANDNHAAVLAMESMRTGHYGEDGYDDTDYVCPVCGAENPDKFYYNNEYERCIGCTDCVCESAYPDGKDW